MADNLALSVTALERRALRLPLNLSAAHPDRPPTSRERLVLSRLAKIYDLSLEADPVELEEQFVRSHLSLLSQQVPPDTAAFVCHSATQAIEIAARVLSQYSQLALIEPAVDFIPQLLLETDVNLVPVPEQAFGDLEQLRQATKEANAIFVIRPNNPTGYLAPLELVCKYCAQYGLALVIDESLRPYDPRACSDDSTILLASGIPWMRIVDTGKLWAANRIKGAILLCSPQFAQRAAVAHSNRLLTISPFNLLLLEQLATTGGPTALADIRAVVDTTRQLCTSLVEGSEATLGFPGSLAPVAAVHYNSRRFTDQPGLISRLASRGLGVTGSHGYYWAGSQHQPFVRLSLSSPPELLQQGLTTLLNTLA